MTKSFFLKADSFFSGKALFVTLIEGKAGFGLLENLSSYIMHEVVFLSFELSDELGKLRQGMASPGRLRTHPTKRSVKRVSFGTISSSGSIPYGCFQKVE